MCEICEQIDEAWLDQHTAAQYTGQHYETLRRASLRGELPRYKRGRKVVYKRSDLDEYLTPKPA